MQDSARVAVFPVFSLYRRWPFVNFSFLDSATDARNDGVETTLGAWNGGVETTLDAQNSAIEAVIDTRNGGIETNMSCCAQSQHP